MTWILLVVYNLGLLMFLPFGLAYLYWRRARTGKAFLGVAERLALRLPDPPEATASVWIHAASVGEVLVAVPLVEQLRLACPGRTIFLSTITPTGRATAVKALGPKVRLLACPFDLWWPVGRVFDRLRPERLIIVETEIWPSLLFAAKRRRVPVSFVNGRISDRSMPGYRRVRRFLAPFLTCPEWFLMQSETDAGRIRELGAPASRVRLTGNMKFDTLRHIQPNDPLAERLGRLWGAENPSVILCGSTLEGEEALLAEIYPRLRREFPGLRLLVAPRHPERFESAGQVFQEAGLRVFRRSWLDRETPPPAVEVILLDTLGELAGLYPMAGLVFVGGSLVPRGGHNVLEPAAASRAILVGPSMDNFRDIARLFLEADAMEQAAGPSDFEARLRRLLGDPDRRQELGRRARELVKRHQGATRRNLDLILSGAGAPAPAARQAAGDAT